MWAYLTFISLVDQSYSDITSFYTVYLCGTLNNKSLFSGLNKQPKDYI